MQEIRIKVGEEIKLVVERDHGHGPITYFVSTPVWGQDDDMGGALIVKPLEGEKLEVSRLRDAFGEAGNDADGFTIDILLFGSRQDF